MENARECVEVALFPGAGCRQKYIASPWLGRTRTHGEYFRREAKKCTRFLRPSTTSQTVIHHASTAWKCSPRDIHVEQLDSETFRAEGCERQADYSCPTNGGNDHSRCERVSGT
jgi:hypothetical protein